MEVDNRLVHLVNEEGRNEGEPALVSIRISTEEAPKRKRQLPGLDLEGMH